MKIFQKPYDYFRYLKTPKWLKELLATANTIMLDLIKEIGVDAMEFIKTQVIDQYSLDISGEEKLKNVKKAFMVKYGSLNIPDSLLNLAVEILLNALKQQLSKY